MSGMLRQLRQFWGVALQTAATACVLGVAACGDDPERGTVFDPPAWVERLGDSLGTGTDAGGSSGGGSSSGGSSGGSGISGMQARIPGVAETLIMPQSTIVTGDNGATKFVAGTATADDASTVLTLSFTVLSGISPPDTLDLVIGPPTGNDVANITYTEVVTGASPNNITAVVGGELVLDQWSDVQIQGTFNAQVWMTDGALREIADGSINVTIEE